MRNNKTDRTGGQTFLTFLALLAMDYGPLIGIIPMMILFENAEKIGPWWILIFLTLISVFYLLIGMLNWRKERAELEYIGGRELLYQQYPDLLKKELRSRRKEPMSEETARTIEYYQTQIQFRNSDEEAQYIREEKRRTIMYYVVALILAGLAVYCTCRLFFDVKAGAKMDFANVMQLISVVMILVNMFSAVRKTNKLTSNFVAAVLLLFCVLGNLSNHLLMPNTHSLLPVIEDAIVLAVFAFTVFELLRFTQKKPSASRNRLEKKQFDLLMYELGVIDEKELAYRFEW